MSAVVARGLALLFAGGVGLHPLDLDVPSRGVTAVIGPNGAGKTTFFALLTGLERPQAGTVETVGRVAYCPDTPEHEPWLTGREVVAQSRSLVGLPRDDAAAEAVLARCGLAGCADRRVGGWSRGMTQRLGVVAAVATEAPVLVLDEPTSALDPFGQGEVLDLVRELGRDRAVLLSSHSLALVERVADHVALLHRGSLLHQGPLAGLLARAAEPLWVVRTATPDHAGALDAAIGHAPGVQEVRRAGPTTVEVRYDAADRPALADVAVTGVPVLSCALASADLDAAFVRLVHAHDEALGQVTTRQRREVAA